MTAMQKALIKEFKCKCRDNLVAVKNVIYLSSDKLYCDVQSNLTPPVTCEVEVKAHCFVIRFKDNHMVTVRR